MIARYNRLSFVFAVPGLLMQIGGRVMSSMANENDAGMLIGAALLMLVGTGLLVAGLCIYALAKGRSPVWGLMGLLSLIGLIVLGLLKDKAPNG